MESLIAFQFCAIGISKRMPGANVDQLPAGIPKSYLNDSAAVLITTSHPKVAAATVLLLVELFSSRKVKLSLFLVLARASARPTYHVDNVLLERDDPLYLQISILHVCIPMQDEACDEVAYGRPCLYEIKTITFQATWSLPIPLVLVVPITLLPPPLLACWRLLRPSPRPPGPLSSCSPAASCNLDLSNPRRVTRVAKPIGCRALLLLATHMVRMDSCGLELPARNPWAIGTNDTKLVPLLETTKLVTRSRPGPRPPRLIITTYIVALLLFLSSSR